MADSTENVTVSVKTLDSQTRAFTVPADMTVKEFKQKIAEDVNIAADKQRLIYAGRVLQDSNKLSYYDVKGKVIHLVERAPPRTSAATGTTPTGGNVNSTTGSDTHGPTPGMGGGGPGTNYMVSAVTLSGQPIDQQQIQGIVEQVLTGMGDLGRQAQVTTSASPDGTGMDVQINLGQIQAPIRNMQNEAHQRIRLVRRMVTSANRTLDRLEKPPPDPPTSGTGTAATSSASSSSEGGAVPMTTVLEQDDDTEEAADNQSPTSEGETSATRSPPESCPDTVEGATTDRRQCNISSDLAAVLDDLTRLHERLRPHLTQYQVLMVSEEDFTGNETERRKQQRLFNSVAEVLHFYSHAFHSVSDLMIDLGRPTPRHLLALPLPSVQQSVLQHAIPIHTQVTITTTTVPGTATSSTSTAQSNNQPSTVTSTGTTPSAPLPPHSVHILGPQVRLRAPMMRPGGPGMTGIPIPMFPIRGNIGIGGQRGQRPQTHIQFRPGVRTTLTRTNTTQSASRPRPPGIPNPPPGMMGPFPRLSLPHMDPFLSCYSSHFLRRAGHHHHHRPPQPTPTTTTTTGQQQQQQQHNTQPGGVHVQQIPLDMNNIAQVINSAMSGVLGQFTGGTNTTPRPTPTPTTTTTSTGSGSQPNVTQAPTGTQPPPPTTAGGPGGVLGGATWGEMIGNMINILEGSDGGAGAGTTAGVGGGGGGNPFTQLFQGTFDSMGTAAFSTSTSVPNVTVTTSTTSATAATKTTLATSATPGSNVTSTTNTTSATNTTPATSATPGTGSADAVPDIFTTLLQSVFTDIRSPTQGQQQRNISDVMSSLSTQFNITPEQGMLHDLFQCLYTELSFTDVIMVLFGTHQPLQRVRPGLQQFVSTHILNGERANRNTIDTGVARLVNNNITPAFIDMFRDADVKDNIDILATNQGFFKHHLTMIVEVIMCSQDNSATFSECLVTLVNRMITEWLILHVNSLSMGRFTVETVLNRYLHTLLTQGEGDSTATQTEYQWMQSMTTNLLSLLLQNSAVSFQQVQHFIVKKETSAELPVGAAQSSSVPPTGPGKGVADRTGGSGVGVGGRTRDEPMDTETDTASVAAVASTSTYTDTTHSPFTQSNHDNTTSEGAVAMDTTDSGVNGAGRGADWRGIVSAEWVPVIERDMISQETMGHQPPFSTAYMSGMSAKRRKVMNVSESDRDEKVQL